MTRVVDLYTIQVILGDNLGYVGGTGSLRALMAETEENLTDLLPDGYSAKIRRWNDPDPDERNKP